MALPAFRVAVVTVSDRCHRRAPGYEDASGPAVARVLASHPPPDGRPLAVRRFVVPDERDAIAAVVVACAADYGSAAAAAAAGFEVDASGDGSGAAAAGAGSTGAPSFHLVVTTGGTGFAERDVTPEAVGPLLDRAAPGLVHAIVAAGLAATPVAWLARPVAGVRRRTVVVSLPGSRAAVAESLAPLLAAGGLWHAISLASGDSTHAHPAEASAATTPASTAPASASERRTPAVATRDRESSFALLAMPDALAAIARHAPPPKAAVVSAEPARLLGRVLADDARSAFPHPPFRASVKDGYAVVAADGPGVYAVLGSLVAGDNTAAFPTGARLAPGAVWRVNTGGPVPDGADAVVQVEDTDLAEAAADGAGEALVRIRTTAAPGQDIRPVGCDLAVGAVAVAKGAVLRAPEIGLLRSLGIRAVSVFERPTVAVLSTGDELVDAGSAEGSDGAGSAIAPPPPPGKVFDSNRPMLLAAVAAVGCAAVDAGIAADEMTDTRRKLEAAWRRADVVISTGGVSMGEVDCVKKVLLEMGATVHFGRVNMKPGKPTTFASLGSKLFFALPGNPVSAMVCFHVFVVPALRQMAGLPPALPSVRAALSASVRLDTQRPEYHRCFVGFSASRGGLVAVSTGVQASHRLLSMAGANGLMVLPAATPGQATIAEGETVEVVVIGDLVQHA